MFSKRSSALHIVRRRCPYKLRRRTHVRILLRVVEGNKSRLIDGLLGRADLDAREITDIFLEVGREFAPAVQLLQAGHPRKEHGVPSHLDNVATT